MVRQEQKRSERARCRNPHQEAFFDQLPGDKDVSEEQMSRSVGKREERSPQLKKEEVGRAACGEEWTKLTLHSWKKVMKWIGCKKKSKKVCRSGKR